MDIEEFEKIVDSAVASIPKKFKKAIDNVSVVVEDIPRAKIAKGQLLLGLYQGTPKTAWGRYSGMMIPDKITIFKEPIEFLGRGDKRKIKELIIDTVLHEIAHHFGISDRRLSEIRRNKS